MAIIDEGLEIMKEIEAAMRKQDPGPGELSMINEIIPPHELTQITRKRFASEVTADLDALYAGDVLVEGDPAASVEEGVTPDQPQAGL